MVPAAVRASLPLAEPGLQHPRIPTNTIPILNEPAYSPRRMRVVCIGAGYSGLTLAYEVKHNKALEGLVDLKIYDKNEDIGGTWLENRYPGVACDVPAHVYSFPFEPNPDWSTFYAAGPEIWSYVKRTADKYGLTEHVQLQAKVSEATWDEDSGKWLLKVEVGQDRQVEEDQCDILVDGSGFLNNYIWPDIMGFHDFKGKLVHTANWDPSIDVKDKRVAVIGNGSSAIQVLPQLQKAAAQITNYIRSPTWIMANFSAGVTKGGTNYAFSDAEKKEFRENPASLNELRKKIEQSQDHFFRVFFKDSQQNEAARKQAIERMTERLGNNSDLCKMLIPDYEFGCRRQTPGDGYLEALIQENAQITTSPILFFTESGIQTTRGHSQFDIIVCATGFDSSFSPSFPLRGRDGFRLNESWRDTPQAYFGIAAINAPNYFKFIGPNSPVAQGSLPESMSHIAKWIMKWCQKMATEDIKSICVKQEAIDDYNAYSQEFLKGMVWSGSCQSWYKNRKRDGRVTAVYAGGRHQFREILETFRTEDFNIEYRSPNRFRFMGNGFTLRETTGCAFSAHVER